MRRRESCWRKSERESGENESSWRRRRGEEYCWRRREQMEEISGEHLEMSGERESSWRRKGKEKRAAAVEDGIAADGEKEVKKR